MACSQVGSNSARGAGGKTSRQEAEGGWADPLEEGPAAFSLPLQHLSSMMLLSEEANRAPRRYSRHRRCTVLLRRHLCGTSVDPRVYQPVAG